MRNPLIKRRGAPAATALLMALALAACGGGGGNPGATGGSGSGGTGGGTGGTGGTGSVAVSAPASVQFVLAAPADKSIVIKGQGGNGRTETASLTFKVLDVQGNPLANQQVNFVLVTAGGATLNTTGGKTGADGTVVASVNSGSNPATFRVQATLPNTAANGKPDLSTLSDTITVTTGLPVQKSFSISTTVFNPEGWNIDSSPAKPAANIQVLLADAFGNPVPDGTPIVFQTNMGSVGSADRGGCITQNGGCSVDFRAQNPRVATAGLPATPCNSTGTDGKGAGISADIARPGVATVCASSTDGTSTLFGRTAIFFSGSDVGSVYLDSVYNRLDLSKELSLGAVAPGAIKTFSLQLNDVNQNPMPAGTTVAITNPQGLTPGVVVPAAVPNIDLYSSASKDPSGASGYALGSWHRFTVTAATPATCAAATEASFYVTVTTPGTGAGTTSNATVTNIPFKLSITCP
jgi:hypothetical protein